MATENPFVKLFSIDFKDHVEVKKSGNTELKYVSWAYAWAEVKKLYPSASYEVKSSTVCPMSMILSPDSWSIHPLPLRAFRMRCGCLYWMAQTRP